LQVLFEKWLSLLQQVSSRLPYKEENWQTVLAGALMCCAPCKPPASSAAAP